MAKKRPGPPRRHPHPDADYFRHKLDAFIRDRGDAIAPVASELGVSASTLQRWVDGAEMTLTQFRVLLDVSLLPCQYWLDESIPPIGYVRPGRRPGSSLAGDGQASEEDGSATVREDTGAGVAAEDREEYPA